MKNTKEFPFDKARRITAKETHSARRAIEKITRQSRASRGRPAKKQHEKFRAVSIRLHPKIITWAKKTALQKGTGYQTVINDALLSWATHS